MKIRINRFCLFVPLSSEIVRLLIKRDMNEYTQILGPLISTLKEYKKANGHFNLVEVENEDGNRIVITI